MWQNIVFGASITVTGRYELDPPPEKGPVDDLDNEDAASCIDPSVFYHSLDSKEVQTRILTLYPGEANESLHCAIETVSLEDTSRDEYEALSYCWGDTTDQKFINLKSTSSTTGLEHGSRRLRVHRSLYSALLHLRPSSGPPRKLWADAICINQADYAERAQQVTTMPLIYQHAKRVVIWLGPITPKRQFCVAKIQEIQRSLDQLRQASHAYTEHEWLQLVREAARTIASDREDAKNFLQAWAECDFDWFARTWVLQEVANSIERTVLCGTEELNWDTFCSLELRIQKAQEEGNWRTFLTPSIMPSTFLNLVSDKRTPERGMAGPPVRQGILETIIAAHVMKATDPRDKLFAMLQFGEDTSDHVRMDLDLQDPRIRPDYYKNPTTVFCDFTHWWIDKHKSLRILSAIHTLRYRNWQKTYYGEPPPLDYPSWSLNLSQGGDSDWANETLGLDIGTDYRASGSTQPNIAAHSTENSHVLKIAGYRLCKIQEIKPFPYWQQHRPLEAWQDMREVLNQISDTTGTRKSKGAHSKRVDMMQDADDRHYTCHLRAFYQDNQASLPCISPCLFVAEGDLHETSARRGLCPHNALPGDIVVMLFGGAVLYLLRPKREPDSASVDESSASQQHPQDYYFVGECYLHGYMHGRALEEANEAFAAGRNPEVFDLV